MARNDILDIFISYSHKDEDFVRMIVPALQSEGFTVWWDHTIAPGQTWDGVIAQGIKEAKVCVVVWSQDSAVSDWVKEEATLAKTAGKYLPVQIGGELPLGFGRIQAADLRHWFGNGRDPQWRLLIEEVKKRVGVGTREPIPVAGAAATATATDDATATDAAAATDAATGAGPALTPIAKWLIGLAPLLIAAVAWWMFSGDAASVVGKWNGNWHMDSDPPGLRFGFVATFMPDHSVIIQNPMGTFTGHWRQSGKSLTFEGGGGTDSATVNGDQMAGTVEVPQRKGTFDAHRER